MHAGILWDLCPILFSGAWTPVVEQVVLLFHSIRVSGSNLIWGFCLHWPFSLYSIGIGEGSVQLPPTSQEHANG